MYKSKLLNILNDRGFIHQITDPQGLDNYLVEDKNSAVYIGFDCTASSLHVGSLIQIMILRHLQNCGLKPIVLLGGGTTRVGDPSGRDETRKLLNDAAIDNNLNSIKKILEKFIKFGSGKSDALLVNNNDWLSGLNYIEFIRDIGSHFSINKMLSFDSVKLRLEREQHLSFLEFNYMILQAYDFVELYKKHNCRIQIGGSDQWGNIVNGIELGRRLALKEDLLGLTTMLITTASGAKMGKTAQGSIWLTEAELPAYDYWQFWRNTDDRDVIKFLKLFTELPLEEIQELAKLKDQKINEAKIILANEVTKLCHGEEAARVAFATATQTFAAGGSGFGAALPEIDVSINDLKAGIPAYKLLHMVGICESGSEARRVIKGGGGKINDVKIEDELQNITDKDVTSDNLIKLSAGKKKHGIVRVGG